MFYFYKNQTIKKHLIDYPTPINFNYFWSFGSLAGIFLVVQLLSGIFLAMHYSPHTLLAFNSVEHIMRDVNFGWLFRYVHANGASFFFIMVYCHMGKGLYYSSYVYPMANLWRVGVLIFILMMATAFMGYVLPWGQMSFWGATVITNLFTAIPLIGQNFASLLWGAYSIANPTLNRFFSLHFTLPFVICGLVLIHLVLLHMTGSTNPVKQDNTQDKIPFYPYFYFKDLFSLVIIFFIFSVFIFFYPNKLGHADNYIEANALITPTHIVPEWYFLPFYAILRSIPNKLGGVLCMAFALIILFFLPNLLQNGRFKFLFVRGKKIFPILVNPNFRPSHRILFWIFCAVVLLLGWLGAQPVETPYILIGLLATNYYFFHFLVLNKISFFLDMLYSSYYL